MIRAAARICLVYHGQLDVALNAEGMARARVLASSLLWESFETACSSDRTRAMHTADVFARVLDLPVTTLTALRERNPVDSRNLTRARWRSRHPQDLSRFERRDTGLVMPAGLSWIEPEGPRRSLLGRADNADLIGALGELAAEAGHPLRASTPPLR
jgi:broad specificity phosphatase PhoE